MGSNEALTLFLTKAPFFFLTRAALSPDEGRARRGDYSDSNAQMKIRLVRTVVTKQARLIEMLRRPDGATIAELVKAIRWQAHSVRGAMSGALKKKLGLTIETQKVDGRGRIYRITN